MIALGSDHAGDELKQHVKKHFEIEGDAFAPRNEYAMKIDFIKEPPMFKISDTHYAKTWLLDPRAPHVEPPHIVKELSKKIASSKVDVKEKEGE